jgi:cell volume regulation protein A
MEAMNLLLLGGGLLVFLSLLAGVFSTRFGLSFLLVFLIAGMLVGEDGPGGVRFDSPTFAAWVGNASLAVILLEGGIGTRMDVFRKGFKPALLLATIGVVVTASIVGAVAMWAMNLDWRRALLLGAIVGSTDAAAVFSLLRHVGVRLNERVAATLELESGLNDPMAVFMVLALIAGIQHQAGFAEVLLLLAKQAGFGAAAGWFGARLVAWLLRRLPLTAEHGGLLSLLIVSAGMAVFALAGIVEGSGFLAVYLFGLRVRALAEDAAHSASSALDGFAWAAQATMFLLLGLLVTPHDMLRGVWPTLGVAATLILVARPFAVALCLAPLRFRFKHRLFIGWVGLRGAVPIVLALFPVIEHVPGTARFFDVAFAVVMMSLLLQGTTLGWAARRTNVVEPPDETSDKRAVQGRLTLDGDQPLAEVFDFFKLPMPKTADTTLGDWLGHTLARGSAEGDGIDWHGAHFRVVSMADGRVSRIGVALAPKEQPVA